MRRTPRLPLLTLLLTAVALVAGVLTGSPVLAAPAAAAPAPAAVPAAAAPPAATAAASAADQAVSQQMQQATALAKAGKYDAAIAQLEPLRKAGKATPRVLSLLGTLYLQVGKPREAAAVLKPLADAPDAEAAVLFNAGRAAQMLNEEAAAQAYFERSLALEPASPAARDLGLLLAHRGRVVEAYSMLRPWAIRNPRDNEAVLTAIALALDLERTAEAEQLIIALKPTDPTTVLINAKIFIQKRDGQHAVDLLTPLLAQHPKGMDGEIRRCLAEADLLIGQPKQAVALLAGADVRHPSIALLLAKAQHQSGNPAAALATLKPLADVLPNDPKGAPDPRVAGGVAIEYGRLLAETGHAPEGIAFVERATRIEPAQQEAWQALQQLLIAAGRLDDAKKAGEKAAALAPALTGTPPAADGKPPHS